MPEFFQKLSPSQVFLKDFDHKLFGHRFLDQGFWSQVFEKDLLFHTSRWLFPQLRTSCVISSFITPGADLANLTKKCNSAFLYKDEGKNARAHDWKLYCSPLMNFASFLIQTTKIFDDKNVNFKVNVNCGGAGGNYRRILVIIEIINILLFQLTILR